MVHLRKTENICRFTSCTFSVSLIGYDLFKENEGKSGEGPAENGDIGINKRNFFLFPYQFLKQMPAKYPYIYAIKIYTADLATFELHSTYDASIKRSGL